LQKHVIQFDNKLEAQWAEPVSLTFQSALRKLYTERPCIRGRTLEIWNEDNFTIHLYENVLKNTYNFGLF
jgi:hypothetical protein